MSTQASDVGREWMLLRMILLAGLRLRLIEARCRVHLDIACLTGRKRSSAVEPLALSFFAHTPVGTKMVASARR